MVRDRLTPPLDGWGPPAEVEPVFQDTGVQVSPHCDAAPPGWAAGRCGSCWWALGGAAAVAALGAGYYSPLTLPRTLALCFTSPLCAQDACLVGTNTGRRSPTRTLTVLCVHAGRARPPPCDLVDQLEPRRDLLGHSARGPVERVPHDAVSYSEQ